MELVVPMLALLSLRGFVLKVPLACARVLEVGPSLETVAAAGTQISGLGFGGDSVLPERSRMLPSLRTEYVPLLRIDSRSSSEDRAGRASSGIKSEIVLDVFRAPTFDEVKCSYR